MEFDPVIVYGALATIWGAITSAMALVYRSHIRDLRSAIQAERQENRVLIEEILTHLAGEHYIARKDNPNKGQ